MAAIDPWFQDLMSRDWRINGGAKIAKKFNSEYNSEKLV